ncbi:MAG: response regulator [Clostridium sp.]|nr:response regulator [Clostridium sp.]
MWKLVIADDEPKIRRGLKKIINWTDYDIEICGEAEDGELALNVINETEPDIILLDINMPFINGLELLKKIRDVDNKAIVIIITSYDEFTYAQKAVKLEVFDYLLKPVSRENMDTLISSVVKKLESQRQKKTYGNWVKKQLSENIDELREKFFQEWVENRLSNEEILKELKYFNIDLKVPIGVMVINITENSSGKIFGKKWNQSLMAYAIENLLNEEFKEVKNRFLFKDINNNIILLIDIDDINKWLRSGKDIENYISIYIKLKVSVEQEIIHDDMLMFSKIYNQIIERLKTRKSYSSIVAAIVDYIEKDYYLNSLNVNDVAEDLEISSSYVSKTLKKETGYSFIDYLNKFRMEKAMEIMEDPTVRIYDVAELVGYSNQHYFCRAFKKYTGISPSEYRKGK